MIIDCTLYILNVDILQEHLHIVGALSPLSSTGHQSRSQRHTQTLLNLYCIIHRQVKFCFDEESLICRNIYHSVQNQNTRPLFGSFQARLLQVSSSRFVQLYQILTRGLRQYVNARLVMRKHKHGHMTSNQQGVQLTGDRMQD